MIFAKVDVKLRDHIRAHKAGNAMSTWLWALLYVREQETDGFVPAIAMKLAWAGERDAIKHAELLVAVGLWEIGEDGWRICRYDSKNETKASIETRRKETRERVTRHRGNASCNALQSTRVTEGTVVTVPGSGSGSGSDDLEIASDGVAPPWFHSACDTVETALPGETINRPAAWLRYEGHRSGSLKTMSQKDAQYWLMSVDVREAQKDRQEAADKRERWLKRDAEGPRLAVVRDTAPAPYHAPARPAEPDEEPVSPAERLAGLRRAGLA